MENVISRLTNPDGSLWYTFYCPGCQCSHHITTAWSFNGDHQSPTITPSILVNANLDCPTEPRCHLYVTNGQIQYLADSTHALAGQTVKMLPE